MNGNRDAGRCAHRILDIVLVIVIVIVIEGRYRGENHDGLERPGG